MREPNPYRAVYESAKDLLDDVVLHDDAGPVQVSRERIDHLRRSIEAAQLKGEDGKTTPAN